MVGGCWWDEVKMNLCAGSLGLQHEEGKGVISWWVGSVGRAWLFWGFSPKQDMSCFSTPVFQFQVSQCARCNIQQRLACPPVLWSEVHPILHPQGFILSHGMAGLGTPCSALSSPLCKPEPAFTPGTESPGGCSVGMSRCNNCCASFCL